MNGGAAPGEKAPPERKRCAWCKAIVGAVILLAVLTGFYALWRFTQDHAEAFDDPVEHFKYGSTGGDKNFGIPFVVWQALPVLFKDLLPEGRQDEGWEAFGFIYEYKGAGADRKLKYGRPIGTTLRNSMGLERTFLNCAGCHVSTVRRSPEDAPRIVAGMPAHRIDLQAFQNFLIKAALDERFTPERILAQIDAQELELDWINRLALKLIGVYQIRERILTIRQRFRFADCEPPFGPGRFDTFSPAKALLNWPLDCGNSQEAIGVVDFPSIWLQAQKQGLQLHWDGNNTKVEERNRSAAFGTGATPPILDRKSVRRMEDWLLTAAPPAMTDVLGIAIDEPKAKRGEAVYGRFCASCHGANGRDFTGAAVGGTTPIGAIGTDRHRLDNYTYALSIAQNVLYAGNAEERFQNFRKTGGYANMPLDGLWLRAPYLHNGSVSTLADLLKPPAQRPKTFYRGCDLYDADNVGFASDRRPDACPGQFLFDTGLPGNGNGGHIYGTLLSSGDKADLIEFLKTF